MLVQDGPNIFIEKVNGESELEPIVWTPLMKKHLVSAVENYLSSFKTKLAANRKAVFEYFPFHHVSYAEFKVADEEIPWEAEEKAEYELQKKKEEEKALEKKRREEERQKNFEIQKQQDHSLTQQSSQVLLLLFGCKILNLIL